MKNTIALTTDAVVFSKLKKDFYVLLIQRKNEPFKAMWALPGGFVEEHEKLNVACQRELKEETSLDVAIEQFSLLGIFDDVNRDPRSRTVSVAYFCLLNEQRAVSASDDAQDADWFRLDELQNLNLAFDHFKIIEKAKSQLQNRDY